MTSFPLLADNTITQLPFTAKRDWTNQQNRMEAGHRYVYAYDSTPLLAWELSFSALTDAERDALLNFFIARKGPWESFYFTDPDTATQYTVRFADSELPVTYLGPNAYQITVRLIQCR